MADEVVTSRGNARVKQLRAAFAGQARLASGLVAIEGEHLLEEAVKSQQALKTVFVSERRELPKFVPRGIEVVRLANDVFQSCVETQTPQGIAALMVPRVSTRGGNARSRFDRGSANLDCGRFAGSGKSRNAGSVSRSLRGHGSPDNTRNRECVESEGASGIGGECIPNTGGGGYAGDDGAPGAGRFAVDCNLKGRC